MSEQWAAAPGATEHDDEQVSPARLKALWAYVAEHRATLVVVLVLSVIGAGLSLAGPLVINQVISSVESGNMRNDLVWLVVALTVSGSILGAFQMYFLERVGEGIVLSSRKRLIASLLRLPIGVYDTRRSGDLVSRVASDTTMIRAALTGGIVDALGGSLVFVGSIIAMAVIDLMLLGITLAVVAIAVVAVVIASGRIQKLTMKTQVALGHLGADVDRAVSAIRTIRASNATDAETDRLSNHAREAYDLGVRTARVSALLMPISGLAVQGAFLAVLGVGGYRVASGSLSVADLVAFILFLFMMIMPLAQSFQAVMTVRTALGALARIEEILDIPGEQADDSPTTTTMVAGPLALAFRDVAFSYNPDEPILRGVNFEAAAGKVTAIVGPSGAGKSTLLSLATRFYDPTAGTVSMGGTDVRDLPRDYLRSRVAYVEQNAPVLAGTIGENLTLAAPHATPEQCWSVLERVNLAERVAGAPDGLDTRLGDDGLGLSGGERQRLAIARSLLADTSILLLDEPTAALDSRNEQFMHAAINAAAGERTVIIVAHRLATVVGADHIVVMNNGEVEAAGTHDELLRTSPLYAELSAHQLLDSATPTGGA